MKRVKKLLVFLCVLSVIVGQSTLTFASVRKVESEPNNTLATADSAQYSVSDNFLLLYGVVSTDDPVDWFKVRCKDRSGGSDVRMYLYKHSNFDLYLYNESGQLLGSSTNRTGDTEYIKDIYIRENQYYYIKVQYVSGRVYEPYEIFFGVTQ